MTINLSLMASEPDDRPPAPVVYARPCCPPDLCIFRPKMVKQYLFIRNLAQIFNEPWEDVLADRLSCHCGHYTNCRCPSDYPALARADRGGDGSVRRRAHDIVIRLEMCRDELGIPLTFTNCDRLAQACCRFAVQESE